MNKVDEFINHCEEMAIKLLEEKGYKIEKPEPEKIELKGGAYRIFNNCECGYDASITNLELKTGSRFETLQIAEAVAAHRLKRNRLEAYAVQYMGSVYQFVIGNYNYFLCYYHENGEWGYDTNIYRESAGEIYMTKDCAEYLCEALNSGRIIL